MLSGDPALYTIIPLVSEGKSGQLAVWEKVYTQQTNSTKSIPLTLTIKSKPTPHSITPTSPGAASIESVVSVTGDRVGGHSVQTQRHVRVGDHPIDGGREGHTYHCVQMMLDKVTIVQSTHPG